MIDDQVFNFLDVAVREVPRPKYVDLANNPLKGILPAQHSIGHCETSFDTSKSVSGLI